MKAKIDLEKFICSYVKWNNIQDALKDQGLKCWNGEIVEIPQESEDERIRKTMSLENQGEQKPTLEEATKAFLEALSETPYNNAPIVEAQIIAKQLLIFLSAPKSYNPDAINEQKPNDKVEPKFEIGDWITDGYVGGQIISIEDNYTCYKIADFEEGISTNIPFTLQDNYHLWTIQDAKDGDVLACEDGWTCIFKSLNDGDTFGSYCFMDNTNWLCEKGSECHTLNTEYMKAYHGEIKPATKEQRGLLFQKMKEAGYEWDEEKKVLRKIEQKLDNSAKTCKNDTLLDLLQKMPSCITVDGIDYHFVMKKTIAFMAFYEGEGEGSGKVIFWMAGDPVALLTAMLNKLKEEGLLE